MQYAVKYQDEIITGHKDNKIWLFLMVILLLSGDLELNPGSTGGLDIEACSWGLGNKRMAVCFGHLNVRSLSCCVDELRNWVSVALERGDKVFLFCSEMWLNEGIPDGLVSIQGLRLLRKDRSTLGGDVAVYCSEDVNCVRRMDLKRNGLEVLWVVED